MFILLPKLSKNIIFKLIIAIYIGLAIFRITDPNLRWVKEKPFVVSKIIKAPTDIKIAKIDLDLAISPSVINDKTWQVFDDRVAWLSTSKKPGEGNVILYAHERAGLFLNLKNIKIGDEIEIYNGEWRSYKVSEIKIVKPNDIDAVISDKDRLTIYTCNGSFDQKRLIVYAE